MFSLAYMALTIKLNISRIRVLKRIGVREDFRLRGWGQLPEYFIHCSPENKVVLPEYHMMFARKWLFEHSGGGGGLVRLCWNVQKNYRVEFTVCVSEFTAIIIVTARIIWGNFHFWAIPSLFCWNLSTCLWQIEVLYITSPGMYFNFRFLI